MAEYHYDIRILIHERQTKPELKYLGLAPGRHLHNALSGPGACKNFLVSSFPIGPLIAQIEIRQHASSDLKPKVVAQPGPGEPYVELQGFISLDVIETERWQ